MRGTGGRVCGGYLFAFAPVMSCSVDVVSRNKINIHTVDFVFSSHDGAHFIP